MRRLRLVLAVLFAVALGACADGDGPPPAPADFIVTGPPIYVGDAARTYVEALAVRDGEIVYAGDLDGTDAFAGASTETIALDGALILPGLHDTHIHPVSAMDVGECTLDNEPLDLAEISAAVAACRTDAPVADEAWFAVNSWNFAVGNAPAGGFQTIRAALDAAAPETPTILYGSDGHHNAVNSAALAAAEPPVTAATLRDEYKDYAVYFGVDETGEPNGRVNEDPALDLLSAGVDLTAGWRAARLANAEKLFEVTAPRGITSFMDAAVRADERAVYDEILERGEMKARATLALHLDPNDFRRPDGGFDAALLIAEADKLRAKYAAHALIKADFLKLFADGVLEGDPLADPPTLPNAAFSRDYKQPIFKRGLDGALEVEAYVDPDADYCADAADADPAAFRAEHGHDPAQCARSNGVLNYSQETIDAFVDAGTDAGYRFMIHAIGDRTVTASLDAIAAAQAGRKPAGHIVTHLHLVRPEDRPRFAKLGAYASFTFAWAITDRPYDMTIIPFLDDVSELDGLYDPQSTYVSNAYPAASIAAAGGAVIAGSDAPVDTPDPRPFVNVAAAVTRATPGAPPLNEDEAIDVYAALDAYTRLAAEALRQDKTGMLQVGRLADFIVVDRHILDLAAEGRAFDIAETTVLETWLGGERVYAAPSDAAE